MRCRTFCDDTQMNYTFETDGEQLAYFVQQRILTYIPWRKLSAALLPTGRADCLIEFFHEVVIVNLTCRIIVAGTSLLDETADRPARNTDDASFQRDYRAFIRDSLLVNYELVDDLLRMALRAVHASREHLSDNQRSRHRRNAQNRHPRCYMCGTSLDFSGANPHTTYTLDHIWPRRYGGNSTDDNLLPACHSCNNLKKADFATWAMPSVQSLVLGFSPSNQECESVEGSHRFAMHYYAARKLAVLNNLSLKRAFLRLGPWTNIRPRDAFELGDFFNLQNHVPLTVLE